MVRCQEGITLSLQLSWKEVMGQDDSTQWLGGMRSAPPDDTAGACHDAEWSTLVHPQQTSRAQQYWVLPVAWMGAAIPKSPHGQRSITTRVTWMDLDTALTGSGVIINATVLAAEDDGSERGQQHMTGGYWSAPACMGSAWQLHQHGRSQGGTHK
jgi:hypothetical protein